MRAAGGSVRVSSVEPVAALSVLRTRREHGMPLSDREQRLLDEIERSLFADDPTFASPSRLGRSNPPRSRARLVVALIALLTGVGCVVVGLVFGTGLGAVIAVIGFVLIVAGCWVGVGTRHPRHSGAGRRVAG